MDQIANMLSQIANASRAGKSAVSVPYSHFKYAIAQALSEEGYVADVERKGRKEGKVIDITLAYESGEPKMHGARRISKQSRREYVSVRELGTMRSEHGRIILSTSKGVLPLQSAKKENVGGEVLLEVW